MKKTSRWLALIAAFCLIFTFGESVLAQTPDSEYFAQTGHNVRGNFLQFYRSVPNPTLVFGYPLTEQFTSVDGKTVQYFQRARFELDPQLGVKLTPLGRETYEPGSQLIIDTQFACRSFAESRYSVCFAFRDFFEQNGGVAQFGYPISPFEFRNNLIVQYFDNARFEWHPERAEGLRVGITDLGRIYFEQLGEDPGFKKPVTQGVAGPNLVLTLQADAFPGRAVTKANDEQTVYVLVRDQNLQSVSGARGSATIRLASGQIIQQPFESNARGVGLLRFNFTNQPNGQLVYVDISVAYNNLEAKTTTSFRIWY